MPHSRDPSHKIRTQDLMYPHEFAIIMTNNFNI